MPLSEKALVALNSIKADFTPVAHADMMKVINASPKFIEQINAFVDREGTITVGPRVGGNAAYSTGESDVAAGGLNTIGGKISFDKNANFKRIDGWSDGYGMAEALAHELGHAFDPGMGATARGAAFSQGGLSKLTYLSVTSEAKGELNAIVLMAEARTNLATANSSSAGNGAKLFADWRMTAFPAVEVAIGALNKSTVAGSLAQTCTVNDTCLKMVTDIMGRAPIFGESAGYNYFKTTIEALDPNAVYVAPQVLSTGNENYVLVPDSANSGRMNVVDKRTGEVVQTIDFQVFEDGSSFFVVSNIGGGFSTLDGGSDGTSRQVDYPIAGDLRFSSTSVRDKDGNVIKSVVDTPGANGGVNRHVEMVIDGKVVEIDQHASSSSTADGVQVGDFRTTAITIGGFPLPESVEAIFSEALDTALSTTDDILEAAANGDVVQVFEAVDMSDLDGWSPEPSGSGATPAWYSVAEVQRLGGLLTSMQSLVAGLETGKPLPIATGIFSIAAHLSNGGGPLGEINSGLGLINGAINLRAALERGDVTAVITSGANLSVGALTIYRTILQAQLADAVSKGLTVSVDQLKGELASVTSVLDGLSNALPFLNLINAIAHGDELGMVSATMAILYEYFAVAWAGPVGIAIAVYQVLKALIDSSDIHGEAKFIKTSNGGVEALLTHDELGGGAAVMTAMDGMINALEATMTDLEGMGIIAQRLPSLMFDGFTGGGGQFTLRYNDAKTGEQFQRSFDENGKFIGIGGGVAPDLDPYNGTFPDPDDVQWEGEIAKTDSFFSNLYQQFLTFSYEVGAVAPTWMVQTINSQETHLAGTTEAGLAGLTTLQIAKDQQQLLETDPGDGNLRPTGEQYVRPVVLDLDGGGFAPKTTRETGGGVLIDVDDDGFAEQTEWIGPREGILVIDRNGDGRISGGHEMFNDSQVVMSERGLTVLREIDANLDGQLTSADFSFAHLRVWQDINHDGEAQSYELSSMSERDISALNYTTGQFTMDGTVRSMALADLTADSAGYMTQTLGEGGNSLLVTQETGQIFLMATALFNPTVSEIEWVRNDLTHVGAGGALIVVDELMDGMEDTPIKVSAAQLLDNDFSQSGTLNITVGSAVHGSVSFSGGTFTFTPTLNYHSNYAALDFASFTYTVSDGQNSVTGTAYIDVVAVDEVPVLENEYDSRPLGWGDVTFVGGDVMNGILPNYIVTGTLEYENDVQWGLQVAQQAPTNLGPPNNPKILGFYNGKAYIADSASNLNWREVQLVDNGSGKVKPSGGVGALTMEVLNGGSTQFGELNFNKQTGDWIYKHTASHALDDAFMIQVTDSLGTVTQHKVIVTNPDSWAGNYFWEDYYAQDWINSSVRDGGAAASAARAATSANAARASAATARADAAAAAESGDPDAATNAANASNLADAAALNAVLAADAAARAAADWGPAAASLAYAAAESAGQYALEAANAAFLAAEAADGANNGQGSGSGASPIVLDLNGNGFYLISSRDSNAFFDFDGDGLAERTGWTSGADGLLAYDANDDGVISNSNELQFKDYLTGAQTDLEGLAHFDTNSDGKLSAADAEWGKFFVWQDRNEDGDQTPDELYSLDGRGVQSINLTRSDNAKSNAGNIIFGTASYTRTDGTTVAAGVADVRFSVSDETDAGEPDDNVSVSGGVKSTGSGNDTINGSANAETIYAGSGNDKIVSAGGNDHIDADSGADRVDAGAGADTVWGGAGDDLIFAGTENDIVHGDAGDDNILGEAGDDELHGDDGNDELLGGEGHDWLYGGTGIDTLIGGAGRDKLYGGSGADRMQGEGDNDGYLLLDEGDMAVEAADSGTDVVASTVNVKAMPNIEIIVLARADNLQAAGDSGANTIYGNQGQNLIDGGAGADKMEGGAGNDTYVVDHAGDRVIERANGSAMPTGTPGIGDDNSVPANFFNYYGHDGFSGTQWGVDTVKASIDWTLDANVENLELTGFSLINGTGNELANVLTGNIAANNLSAKDGNDTLAGGHGNDTLSGGNGNDKYVFNLGDGQDMIFEGVGIDRIVFGAGITQDDITLSRHGDTIKLLVGGYGESISFLDVGVNLVIDEFEFSETNEVEEADWFNTLVNQNAAPTGASKAIAVDEDTDYVLKYSDFGYADTDSDAMGGVKIVSLPTAGILELDGATVTASQLVTLTDLMAGKLVFTPAANASGLGYASFTFVVQDRLGAFDPVPNTVIFDVEGVNDAPVKAAEIGTRTAVKSLPFSFTVPSNTFSDVDAGTVLTLAATKADGTALPAWLSFDALTGQFSGTPAASDVSVLSLIVVATDEGGLSATAAFILNVNNNNILPTSSNKTVTTLEDTAYTLAVSDFSFADGDAGDSLSAVRVSTLPSAGSLKLDGVAVTASQVVLVADIAGGKLTYTPGANGNGTSYASFTFAVRDQNGGFDSTPNTFTFNVTAVNDAPALTGTKANLAAATEDTVYTITKANLLAGYTDAEGNTMSVTSLAATNGTLSAFNSSTNSWTFTPTANFNGAVSLTYGVSDGIAAPTAATQSFNVNAVNDTPTGTVSTSGMHIQGTTLTANSTLADVDGMGTLSYQWIRGSNNISGATGSTYTLTQADVGAKISVRVSYADGGGTAESKTSSQTTNIGNVNDNPTGAVLMIGLRFVGEQLTANTSTLADLDGLGAFSYQWLRNGASISGATSSSYTLASADVGKNISLRVNYTDGFGAAETVTSAPTVYIKVNNPPQGSVTASGTATQNQTLTANTSALTDTEGLGAFSYQWIRAGVDVAGATSSTYQLSQADVGKGIKVRVTYTDGGGKVESVTSAATANVANVNDAPTGNVTITGTVAQKSYLTANTSALADADGLGALSYQWLKNGAVISGATSSQYMLTQGDVGAAISVCVNYTDGFGTAESRTSAPTSAVANVNDAPTGNLTVSGTGAPGTTLAANTSAIADLDGLGTFTFSWMRDSTTISGATGSSYALTSTDWGKSIKAVVNYTDGFGQAESVTSSATTAGKIFTGSSGNDTITDTQGYDVINAGAGNDLAWIWGGNDTVDGGAGLDSIKISSNRDDVTFSVVNSTTLGVQGPQGFDQVTNGERVLFLDTRVAFDMDGNGGTAAKLIGAIFGADYLTSGSTVRDTLLPLDSGTIMDDVAAAAVATSLFAQLAGSHSHSDLVTYIWTNVYGAAPSASDHAYYVGLLTNGTITQGYFAAMAADNPLVEDVIDLPWLRQTGLEYLW